MLRYISGFIAIVIAISAVAFTRPSSKPVKTGKGTTDYYFQFVGTPNLQEGDVTKWNNITATEYSLLNCKFAHDGCGLIATSTQQVGGITRPANIYLNPGTNDPIIGATVSSVENLQAIP